MSSDATRFEKALFRHPILLVVSILALTGFFALKLPALKIYSDFADLLPQDHPYIGLHNEIRDTFGGANVVIVGIEVDEGTIYQNDILAIIHRLTQGVDQLPGINHNLVRSLTHRNARQVTLNETGGIQSDPYYDPTGPELSGVELLALAEAVKANPQIYGALVSPDQKSALIKGTLNEGALDYAQTFALLQELRQAEATDGVSIYATGQPVLIGWVHSYLPQIVEVFLYTVLILIALLIVYFRRFYGVLVPLVGVVISSIWGLGIISWLGFNLDPLIMVVPFLISARALSHGIQLVRRYYHEYEENQNPPVAAANTFHSLFRPGSLGIVSDAISIGIIGIGSIPINDKLALYGSLWALCVIFSVLIFVPALLSILPASRPRPNNAGVLSSALGKVGALSVQDRFSRSVLVTAFSLIAVGSLLSTKVQIGESEPGSPLLYSDHDYNVSSNAINESFPGSEELFVIARTDEVGGIKRPEVLHALTGLQHHMLKDPDMGGAKGLPNLVTQVNRLLHSDDPRWSQIPSDAPYVGGLLFAYMASSPTPGALKEFVDTDEQEANMVFYYKDHKGKTIRRSIHLAQQWIEEQESSIDGLSVLLAGGTMGVTAAINEAAYETNIVVIPLVLILIFTTLSIFYRSLQAGVLLFIAMSFATVMTYAYMGIRGIGINVNTVPIIAVGIGVGIDYSIYMIDRIREETASGGCSINEAIQRAIRTTGEAVCFTALTLIAGIAMWIFVSDLRFQADSAMLLCLMLVLNATAAVLIVPAWIRQTQPSFLVRSLKTK